MFAGRLGDKPDVREVAEAAQAAPAAPQPPRAIDLLLDGLATRFTEGYSAGVPPLRRALDAFRDVEGLTARDVRWLWLACRLAQDLWDDELWHVLATRGVRVARDTGALNLLPNMANYLAALNVHSGRLRHRRGADRRGRCDHAGDRTPAAPVRGGHAGRGARRSGARRSVEYAWRSATERGEGSALGLYWWLTALLHNSHGRYGEALAAARQACEHEDVMAYGWALVELIEAGVRVGRPDEAAAALDRLSERTRASGTDWALGIEAGSRALLSDGQAMRSPSTARRSSGSRAAVAWSTSPAPGSYTANGCVARTAASTRASNSEPPTKCSATSGPRGLPSAPVTSSWPRVRPRGSAPTTLRGVLTPQEAHIARLARDGLSNPEIGAQLFISPRTVQYHLRKVFLKLDITSRNQLSRVPASQLNAA